MNRKVYFVALLCVVSVIFALSEMLEIARPQAAKDIVLKFISSNVVRIAKQEYNLDSAEDGYQIRRRIGSGKNVYIEGLARTGMRQFWYLIDPKIPEGVENSVSYVNWGIVSSSGVSHLVKLYGYDADMFANERLYKGIVLNLYILKNAGGVRFSEAEVKNSYLEIRYSSVEETGKSVQRIVDEYLVYADESNDIYFVPMCTTGIACIGNGLPSAKKDSEDSMKFANP